MKTYLIIVLQFAICLATLAQDQQLMPAKTANQASINMPQPYMLAGDAETVKGALILDPQYIQSINVYKGPQATDKFGSKAKDGAIVIALKSDVALVRLAQVFAAFKVPAQQQNLPVAIDDKLVDKPELLLANLEEIDKVEVKKQDVSAPVRFSFDEDALYLNIITK